MGQLVDLDIREAGVVEIFECPLAPPHCPQSLAALCQRHSHAVHARERVKQRPERVVDVAVVMA